MLRDLSDLRRDDVHRRQQNVARIPVRVLFVCLLYEYLSTWTGHPVSQTELNVPQDSQVAVKFAVEIMASSLRLHVVVCKKTFSVNSGRSSCHRIDGSKRITKSKCRWKEHSRISISLLPTSKVRSLLSWWMGNPSFCQNKTGGSLFLFSAGRKRSEISAAIPFLKLQCHIGRVFLR